MQLREHNKTHLAEYKSHSVFVDKRSFCLNIDYVVVVVVVCVCVCVCGGGGGVNPTWQCQDFGNIWCPTSSLTEANKKNKSPWRSHVKDICAFLEVDSRVAVLTRVNAWLLMIFPSNVYKDPFFARTNMFAWRWRIYVIAEKHVNDVSNVRP